MVILVSAKRMDAALLLRAAVRMMLGVVAVSTLLTLSGCAPEARVAVPTAKPSRAAPTPTPETYAGPLNFVGDELTRFLLEPHEIHELLPDVGVVDDVSATLTKYLWLGHTGQNPSICTELYDDPSLGSYEDYLTDPSAEISLGAIGARTITWTSATSSEPLSGGRLWAMQFAEAADAQLQMDQYVQIGEQCSEGLGDSDLVFESITLSAADGARAVVGSLRSGTDWYRIRGFVAVENVLVALDQSVPRSVGLGEFDARAVATRLLERAALAKSDLLAKLTANPPEPIVEQGSVDTASRWGDWAIKTTGLGPIRLGDSVSGLEATVPGSRLSSGDWPRRLESEDRRSSLLLAVGDDDVTIVALGVGHVWTHDPYPTEPANLPAADGVRIQSPLRDAIAAFPGGTVVSYLNSDRGGYEFATRDGHLIRFLTRAAEGVTAEELPVTGIIIADATKSGWFGAGW